MRRSGKRLVQLAGGKGARIAVMPSGAGNPARRRQYRGHAEQVRRIGLRGAGVRAAEIPRLRARPKTKRWRVRSAKRAASTSPAATKLHHARRWCARTAAHRRAAGHLGRVQQGRRDRRQQRRRGHHEQHHVLRRQDGARHPAAGVNDGKELAPGLGFVGSDLFVDQHLLARGRFARMLPAMLKKNYKLGLGIDENTAMVINGKRDVEIIGYQGAAAGSAPGKTNGDQGVQPVQRPHQLPRSRRPLQPVTGQYTPSADKIEGKLDPAQPFLDEQVYTADILGHNMVLVMMERLINNARNEAIGIAGPRRARRARIWDLSSS
jgi:cyanophycinase